MKNFFLFTSIFLLFHSPLLQSQTIEKKKVWYSVDYRYLIGFEDKGNYYTFSRSDNFNLYAHNMNGIFGYNLTPRFSTGVGIGISGYHNPNLNTMPIFIDLRYTIFTKTDAFFVFSNIGSANIFNNTPAWGLLFNLGLGYRYPIYNNHSLSFTVNYNLLKYKQEFNTINDDRTRSSVSLGIGFTY